MLIIGVKFDIVDAYKAPNDAYQTGPECDDLCPGRGWFVVPVKALKGTLIRKLHKQVAFTVMEVCAVKFHQPFRPWRPSSISYYAEIFCFLLGVSDRAQITSAPVDFEGDFPVEVALCSLLKVSFMRTHLVEVGELIHTCSWDSSPSYSL